MSSNMLGALYALISFGLFATHDVIVKVLGSSYSPVQIVFFSVLFGFPLAAVMMIRDSTPGTLNPKHPWWMAARTAGVVTTAICAFHAFTVLPLAQVYAMIFAAPLFITLLAIPILGERIHLHRGLAVVMGMVGVLIVLRPGATEITFGHITALLAALGSATVSVITRRIGREERAVTLMIYPMLANVVLMGGILGVVYEPMPAGDVGLLAVIAVLAFLASRLVISAYSAGEAAFVAPTQYSQMIWASLYGWLFFDEVIDTPTAIGTLVIIASGIYIVMREKRGPSGTRPVLHSRSRPGLAASPRIGAWIRLGRKPGDPDL